MPTDTIKPNVESKDDAVFVCTYYEHQYDRILAHEAHRLTISNIVLGITLIAFTFGFSGNQTLNVVTGIGLPLMVFAVNLFAILHFRRTIEFIGTHRQRAKRVLELYAKDLYQIDQKIQWRESGFGRNWSDWRVQVYIHLILGVVALLPVLVYLKIIPK